MTPPYTYNALNPSQREIRLLHLFPGKLGDPLECKLSICSLDAELEYQALSYVWGDPTKNEQIMIQGAKLPITASLHEALQYLRSASQIRVLWVDGICIDQDNNHERESQVLLMNAIYSDTERVLCWLGSSEEDVGIKNLSGELVSMGDALEILGCERGDRGLPCLLDGCSHFDGLSTRASNIHTKPGALRVQELHDILAALSLIDFLSCGWEEPHLGDTISDTTDDNGDHTIHGTLEGAVKFLTKLFTHPWWNRVWTFQEIILPEDAVLVHYHLTIPWSSIHTAQKVLGLHIKYCCARKFSQLREKDAQFFLLWRNKVGDVSRYRRHDTSRFTSSAQTTMLKLLVDCSTRQASNSRDKIYGVLGLVKGTHGINPSYSSETSQVYIQATMSMLQSSGNLSALFCRPLESRLQFLPSWTYDWGLTVDPMSNQGFMSPQEGLYHAGGCLTREPRICCHNNLLLEGVEVDTVESLGIWGDLSSDDQIVKTLKEWETIAGKQTQTWDRSYPNGQTRSDAFRSTLGGDLVRSRQILTRALGFAPPMFERAGKSGSGRNEICHEWWCLIDESEANQPGNGAGTTQEDWFRHFCEIVGPLMRRSRFFVTRRGLMGLGPKGLQPGDDVFVLRGGIEPFALRRKPIPSSCKDHCSHIPDKCFEAIGRCYIHGIMDGQVMDPKEDSGSNVPWVENVEYRVQDVYLI